MKLEEVKRNLNRKVKYKGDTTRYKLTACIIRKNEEGCFYQAEIFDTVSGRSVLICKLAEIEVIE